ncbi:CDP-alcohol phosphatidyltransferase family protein [Nocardioides cavernae]|uniref:CDP-alcohol phosphatidyltransferase family protein n=1 Tax=Nocardioides TaxID=1839 RepID=UPI0009E72EF1|nr:MULTISPECIES: CDP-alcohol phosphatidyltransferase family protein [Nocardioides]MCK9824219.1 CDP-alcohol phosphatidyltransferase family protein [Nocardioides cavernae]
MVDVRRGLVACVLALVALLAVLGTGLAGWGAGLGCAAVLAVATERRATVDGIDHFGPADLVTLTRATLACAVAALVGDASTGADVVAVLVPLTVLALVLDFVDGRVARRTGTASAFGGRIDGEADAFLILVLSAHVARTAGAWVLAMGLVRYAYAVASWIVPWMQRQLPPRYWRKVVAAYVGIALTVAASALLPAAATYVVLGVGVALLAESFGWDVVWLWRRRDGVNRTDARDVRKGKTLQRNR